MSSSLCSLPSCWSMDEMQWSSGERINSADSSGSSEPEPWQDWLDLDRVGSSQVELIY